MLPKNPLETFNADWQQARALNDPNAAYCFLATASKDGQPSVRTLVLREVTDQAFVIFMNNTGPKWQQLQSTKRYELLVFWALPMLQYRIRGTFREIPPDQMKQNWVHKDYHFKLLDHYYLKFHAQSSLIPDRAHFLEDIESLKNEYPDPEEVPFPANIRGLQLMADHVEEWRGSPEDRLHERYLYRVENGQWIQRVMVP